MSRPADVRRNTHPKEHERRIPPIQKENLLPLLVDSSNYSNYYNATRISLHLLGFNCMSLRRHLQDVSLQIESCEELPPILLDRLRT